jgi:hypothetical protein
MGVKCSVLMRVRSLSTVVLMLDTVEVTVVREIWRLAAKGAARAEPREREATMALENFILKGFGGIERFERTTRVRWTIKKE